MTTELDYYTVLGVERGATDAEIKRAFRKLAQQWHPDVNDDPAAQERFKEINEAYQVLSDPDRRQRYDMFGRAGVGGAGGEGDFGFGGGFGGFSDIFDAFFGGATATSARRGRPPTGSDLRYDLRISFEEAVTGTDKEIDLSPGALAGAGIEVVLEQQWPEEGFADWITLANSVKGSGADMAAIEPAGLPAVRLAPLRKLRAFDALADEKRGFDPAADHA